MTTLIIARHGNTFEKGEIPRRVGARTDIPLVTKGISQAKSIAMYLKKHNMSPDKIYSSSLLRTKQTAEVIASEVNYNSSIVEYSLFNEIDYGPDENKTEDEVISRISKEAIEQWDKSAIVPEGWRVNPEEIKQGWKDFSEKVLSTQQSIVLVVTSNGIARFAPHITDDYETFCQTHTIKISTGALCIFNHSSDSGWRVDQWNILP
jgi:probable phosphoglycerate mutase